MIIRSLNNYYGTGTIKHRRGRYEKERRERRGRGRSREQSRE